MFIQSKRENKMNTKIYLKILGIFVALFCMAQKSNASTIYDNKATALNINMLTDTFVSYTHYGETMSDLFKSKTIYGTMTRVDEYGDDGSTLKTLNQSDKQNDLWIDNVWVNGEHINGHLHYNKATARGRFYLATAGATTKSIDMKYGNLYFGGFGGYIHSKVSHITSNGDVAGIFANYNFRNFDAMVLTDIGSLNNNSGDGAFNNSWVNVANETSAKIYLDKTLVFKPMLNIAYTFVSSDDLYVDDKVVTSKDFHFFDITPSLQFIKEISPNWYGTLSAKYVAHFGGNRDVIVGDIRADNFRIDDYTDIGIDVEHNFKQFVFGGKIHKQIGGFDGISGGINVKYVF